MKLAVCNELFGGLDLDRSLAIIKETGFDGVELAPHTIFGGFSEELGPRIPAIRRAIENEGLEFAGLHWLLVGPPDLHVTSPDDSVWRRSWDHVARLINLAGELGGGTLVFGSPAQRASRGLLPQSEALARFIDGLLTVADRAREANSSILLEALAAANTDIMNTLEEVRQVLMEIQHPAVQTVFDFHNVEDEKLDWSELITEYADVFTHVHLNELDGGAPTVESAQLAEFRRAFAALKGVEYRKWVSLEIFTFPEDPATVLRGVRTFLDEVTA